jgi:hypothetical protein
LEKIQFKDGKRSILFGPILIGETTNNQSEAEKGFMPSKADGNLFDSISGKDGLED